MYIQQLSFVVLAVVIILSFFSYKKVVLCWLPAQLLFNAQVAVRYNSPAMSLQIAVNIYLLFFYYFKCHLNGYNSGEARKKFPLWSASALILLSYILSSIIGPYGTFRGFTTAVKYFVTDIGSVFLAYKMLQSRTDLNYFIRCSAVVFCLIISLGISEFVLKDNLWLDFVYLGSPHDDTTLGRMYYTPPFLGGGHTIRYGLIRAISTFGIHIAFGVASLVYFWLFMLMCIKKYYCFSPKLFVIITIMILLGVFLCNSKTGLLGLVLVLISLFPIKQIITPKTFFLFFIFATILLVCFPEYLQNIVSLFDSDVAAEGRGSTIEGRQRQFEVATRMFLYNPILGNGIGSIDVLKKIGDNSDILGAESVWMQILPERGIFGMWTYCYLYIAYYKHMSRHLPHRLLFFFLLSILVMSSVTGEITQSYWGVVLIAAERVFKERQFLPQNNNVHLSVSYKTS